MSLTIELKKESDCKKRKFCIYHHELSMEDLDEYILQAMFDENKLNNLFEPGSEPNLENRVKQLRGFIEVDFKNRENDVVDEEIKQVIESNTNPTYFSFFAEALLARLNIDFLDKDLISGVLTYSTRVTEGRTGADVCMYSDRNLILGEAKFYSSLSGGVKSIIEDSTFFSKLESFCNYVIDAKDNVYLRGIDGDLRTKTYKEIKEIPLVLSGFVLHTKKLTENYEKQYKKINKIKIEDFPDHYRVHLYHLPIQSKKELIFKTQRKALDLICKIKSL